jgi:threonine synthase
METTAAFAGFACVACGERTDEPGRCSACGGALTPAFDAGAADLSRAALSARRFDGFERYRELLAVPVDAGTGTGTTPLVNCPALADELDVAAVSIKDEGQNPTGSVADRDAALVVAALDDVTDIALASAGDDGQAFAAAAARADLTAHVFVPSRAGHTQKSMINVHSGDMHVVEGRLGDAAAAYRDRAPEDWYGVGPGETGLRHEARTTLALELAEQRDWTAPDAVVVPAGHGLGVVGLHEGFRRLRALGFVERLPRLYAAQAEGCAPIAAAANAGADTVDPVEHPDTICGGIEVADPALGDRALAAIEATGGGAVATDDPAILDAAVALAGEGVEVSPSAAAAASGAWALTERGAIEAGEDVVLLNTGAGNKDADVLRSHLMGQGL